MYEARPWLRFYGAVPATLDYPETSMYGAIVRTVESKPDSIAYDFLGTEATYRTFGRQIDGFAAALSHLGLGRGDAITISMPTSPPGVIAFYAANKLGAVASMIHPLSTESEVEFYVRRSRSRFVLTLDAFHEKLLAVKARTGFETLVVARVSDWLPPVTRILFWLKKGRKIAKVPRCDGVVLMDELMDAGFPEAPAADVGPDDLAAILYSGGTTGKPKGIMLSNRNLIAEGKMCATWAGIDDRYPNMLALLPIFHGFGLGVCVNSVLMAGGRVIMVPVFEPEKVGSLVRRKRPNYIVGPPTLYDALARSASFARTDLSCLRATFSGADTLPRVVKERFEAVVSRCGGSVRLLEGYGLTEAVTAIMATPVDEYREGSVGVPFPDMLAKIVRHDTTEEAPAGEEGEICVSGPAVMMGYLDEPEETARTLRTHDDGRTWLHTGDVGTMDADGFFYFRLRKKRMIKSSGMNVYPAQVEEHVYRHPAVKEVCVIGVPDEKQVERVKAFVVLRDPDLAGAQMERDIIEHCRKDLIKWSCPREVEFRSELPRTLVGKIAYRVLEEEERERLRREGRYAG
jgi:long-chain acyl-CoA synthetase